MAKTEGDAWRVIRREFDRRLARAKQHGATQEIVAAAGGLSRQNLISGLLHNRHGGPSVETLVRAVIGLGLQPSEFFQPIEHLLPPARLPQPWAAAAQPSAPARHAAAQEADASRGHLLKAKQLAELMFAELLAGVADGLDHKRR